MTHRHTFIHGSADMQWLFSTHAKFVPLPYQSRIRSAVIYGNEDCPERIDLHWAEFPLANSMPAFTLVQDPDTGDLALT